MAHPEPPTLIIAPPLLPAQIALRAFAAQRHQPKRQAIGTTCHYGAHLPCPTATALLADIAEDWTRVQSQARPEPDTDIDIDIDIDTTT